MSDDRAIITGIGATAPNGLGTEAYWAATLDGKSGIREIESFDPANYTTQVAGQVPEFVATQYVPAKVMVQTDRWTHLALAGAAMALADAGLDPAGMREYEMAVVTASSSGGSEFGQREIQKLWSNGPQHVGAYQSIAWFYAASTGQLSIMHGMRGACGVLASEQAGGLDVVAQSRRLLRRPDTTTVLTGGADHALCPYGMVAQSSTGRLSKAVDPERAYQPFTADAAGYVPGEGGAHFVMERADEAKARGASQRYGEVLGYAATFDPPPGSPRPPSLRRAIEGALADAGLTSADVDVVFADAAGDPELDRIEAGAIAAVFGPYAVPVTAPKTMTGRLYAGGASLDLAAALLSIRDNVIPPTVNVGEVATGCPIDLVTETRPARVRTALIVARGYGGFNAALVVRAI
ncbi:ketosynthase chain-length factor [Fodinicola feengrottensis]|uniref:Ketosynthase chain-length factor n=1 Tax=Fodinicola feengrottensis TaxID=435914 RepID=A0ABN2I962_9ACTN|nr:ketosynthase chain-length factor [Fodinicola feengrottensis]